MIYYSIPGNDKLKISKTGSVLPVLPTDKDKCNELFTIKDDKITLDMYGERKTVALKWLVIICSYGFKLPSGYEHFIFRYRFRPAKRINRNVTEDEAKDRLPFEVIFQEPVYYTKDFRIIPEFPNYAVSQDMRFINVRTGEPISVKNIATEDNKRYPSVSLLHPHYSIHKSRMVHLLVAITWIENDDYVARPLVNHKDGNKSNFRADNLEWASYSENLIHAYEAGLRTDNRAIRVYDKLTNTIAIYRSVSEAFKAMKMRARANLDARFEEANGLYIAKNRYEIKYLDDKTPFMLETMSIKKAKELMSKNFRRGRTYEAINLDTNKTVIGANGAIQKALGLSEGGVTGICSKKTIYRDADNKRWIIRDNLNKPLDISEYKEVSNKKVQIIRTQLSTGEEIEFKSLREAGRETFRIDPITIKNSIKNNSSVRGYKFRYKEEV